MSCVKKMRSNPQLKYWRGVVVPAIAEAMKEENHDYVADLLKNLPEASHILREYYRLKGWSYYRVKSTKELSTVEWEEFMTICREWANKTFRICIAEPNREQPHD